jgi:TPR repeat protein
MAIPGNTYLAQARRAIARHGRGEVAFHLLERSAGMGNAEAIYAIGTWYLFGSHVRKNYRTAAEFLQRASDLGHAAALFDLAISYEKGKGVERDKGQAFRLYMKAALAGDQQAKYEVGRCFYWGIGTTKDRQAAEVWFKAFGKEAPTKLAASRKPGARTHRR